MALSRGWEAVCLVARKRNLEVLDALDIATAFAYDALGRWWTD